MKEQREKNALVKIIIIKAKPNDAAQQRQKQKLKQPKLKPKTKADGKQNNNRPQY